MAVGYGSQLSSEIPAGTESILAKVFFLIMCLHSTCNTEDIPHTYLVLDIFLSSVEENCCRNRTNESKQYLQNIKKWVFYNLRLEMQHCFSIPNLPACFVKKFIFSAAEKWIPGSFSSMAYCKLKNNKNNWLGIESVCKLLLLCSLPLTGRQAVSY